MASRFGFLLMFLTYRYGDTTTNFVHWSTPMVNSAVCMGPPRLIRRIPFDACAALDESGMVFVKGRCDGKLANVTAYVSQMMPNASSCQIPEGMTPSQFHYPLNTCFKVGTDWKIFSCEKDAMVVHSWVEDRPKPPPSPHMLQCDGAPAEAGTLRVSYEVDISLVDLISFEVALASDSRHRPFLHYTAEAGHVTTIPGLRPGEHYMVEARAHRRNHSEGDPNTWSNVTDQKLVCVSAFSSLADSGTSRLKKQVRKTRWLEVYRQNTNGNLPDFLDDHNSADLFSAFTIYAPMAWNAPHPITRYCVEIQDVILPDVMSTTTSGKAVSSPFADFGSCLGGQCLCQLAADRIIARQPREQIHAACPSLDDTMLCRCNESQLQRTQKFTGMMVAPLPFMFSMPHDLELPDDYPTNFDMPIHGHWYSHPSGGRCPPGVDIGVNGCTWQRSPLSHSVYVDDLIQKGLNCTMRTGNRVFSIDKTVSKQDLEVGQNAFAALNLPPCGSESAEWPQDVSIHSLETIVV